jgi:ATP-dependent exoDNAse (exonuclease V) beta subunit
MLPLTVYKASAGSGKTFKLTGEYLHLIFNPKISFQSILAVTFTNKATAEMRERILNELYNLANGFSSKHGDKLKVAFELDDKALSERAAFLLRQIIHNYSRFNISTIDSFFQIILKAFTREIGLNANFNVELNQKQVIEATVEDFFSHIDEKPDLKKWLSEFAQQKIQEGKSWDIQKDMLKFAGEAFNESFFSLSEEDLNILASLETFTEFKKQLRSHIKPFVEKMREFGKQAEAQIQKAGLSVDDFQYKGSGVAGYLLKLKHSKTSDIPEPKVRVMTAYNSSDGIEGWCAKKATNLSIVQTCVQAGLQQTLHDCVDFYQSQSQAFFSAYEVYKNLDVFALVVEVFNHLRSYCDAHDIFLLSMASPFLAKLIDKNDAPFIYEKTGEFLKYYMIDEFQDTSRMQWQNFYPLFHNSISQGNSSLVVGDVKQSIYRWRNSDWNLLHSELLREFALFNPKVENLPYNFRSSRHVVQFNNWCFGALAAFSQQLFAQKIEESGQPIEVPDVINQIYDSVAQKIPENKLDTAGFVSVKFNNTTTDKDEATGEILELVIDSLNELYSKGFQPKDIAILVRRNSEGALIAKHLMEYRQAHPEQAHLFAFVSNDSVFLKSSVIINYLMAAVGYLNMPENELYKARLAYYYFSETMSSSEAVSKLSSVDFKNNQEFEKNLPSAFLESSNELRQLPLVQLINRLLVLLIYPGQAHNTDKNLAFIHTFQDVVLQFTQSHGDNIAAFMEWWENTGGKTAVSLSEDQNAIRILTIHKSKGLEYKAVILPFVQWSMDQQAKLLWTQSDSEPYSLLPVFPITYSSKLLQTAFAGQYLHEYLLAIVDNLNTLYVAFTRAETALYIFAPMPSKNNPNKTINGMLHMAVTASGTDPLESGNWNPDTNTFTFGALPELLQVPLNESVRDVHIPPLSKLDFLKLRLKSADLFNSVNNEGFDLLNKGRIFHLLLEQIQTIQSIDVVVNKMLGTGLIAFADANFYSEKLKSLLHASHIKPFFSGKYRTLTEVSILLPDGSVRRPDRVLFSDSEIIIIDYKFTEQQSKSHHKQVLEYMQKVALIEDIPVKGFVWYLVNNQLVEVIGL